jgi:hypothetical protein
MQEHAMRWRVSLALVLFLGPPALWAQSSPEHLLPAEAQLFVRWDGITAHEAAYKRSAVGQMMQGDTGSFIGNLYKQIQEGVGKGLALEQLLRGAPPARIKKLQDDARAATRLLEVITKKGLLLAIEARTLEPPQAQLTVIIPDGAADFQSLAGALRLGAAVAGVEVKESQPADRKVASLDLGGIFLTWWTEGKHTVFTLGTDPSEKVVKTIAEGDHKRLDGSDLYQRLKGFDKFETVARAYINMASLVKLGSTRGADVRKLMDDLGVAELKSLVFYSGFEGRAERSVVEWDMPGERKGIFSLMAGKPFTLGDVPPLPPDVVSFSMTNFNMVALNDVVVKAAEDIVRLIFPDEVKKVEEVRKEINAALGIDLREDLLAALDGRFVGYSSPAEGPFTLGQTFLLKVKDADKLQGSIEGAIKGLARTAGGEVKVHKRHYRGVDLRMVQPKVPGFPFTPTYAITGGWLVVAFFPQPVEGFIARSKGVMPSWKPGPDVQDSLRHLPKEFISISYSDPRPTLKQLLSIAPLIGGMIATSSPEMNFDVGGLPNAQEVVRHLFPNVSVTTDDGKSLHSESFSSLELGVDLSGIDTYTLFFFFASARLLF